MLLKIDLLSHLLIVGHVAMAKQLWSHVLLGASVSVESTGSVELGHAVVGELDAHTPLWVEGPDENVARLYVPVDNVERVEVADSVSHLSLKSK